MPFICFHLFLPSSLATYHRFLYYISISCHNTCNEKLSAPVALVLDSAWAVVWMVVPQSVVLVSHADDQSVALQSDVPVWVDYRLMDNNPAPNTTDRNIRCCNTPSHVHDRHHWTNNLPVTKSTDTN